MDNMKALKIVTEKFLSAKKSSAEDKKRLLDEAYSTAAVFIAGSDLLSDETMKANQADLLHVIFEL